MFTLTSALCCASTRRVEQVLKEWWRRFLAAVIWKWSLHLTFTTGEPALAEPATTPVRPFHPKRTKWVDAADQVTQHCTGLSLSVSWLPAQWTGAKKERIPEQVTLGIERTDWGDSWQFYLHLTGSKAKQHLFQDYKVSLQENQVNEKMRGKGTDTRSIKFQGVVWSWLVKPVRIV